MVFLLSRPFALSLGVFLVLNAGISVARPALGASRLVVYLPIPEPYLSLGLLLVAAVMLFPPKGGLYLSIAMGILFSTTVVVSANVVRYYLLLAKGLIRSSIPVPFSSIILAVLLSEQLRLYLCPSKELRFSLFYIFSVPLSFFILCSWHIISFGCSDYRGMEEAEAAVVLGARVNKDWSLSPSLFYRMVTGIELLRQKKARFLILSGAKGESGVNEALAMERFALRRGIPKNRILLDTQGWNTFWSAVNCASICRRYGWKKIFLVSQYYHLARAKLIFERQGLTVLTVPAKVGGKIRRSLYYLLRETVALPYYYLYYAFEMSPNKGKTQSQ